MRRRSNPASCLATQTHMRAPPASPMCRVNHCNSSSIASARALLHLQRSEILGVQASYNCGARVSTSMAYVYVACPGDSEDALQAGTLPAAHPRPVSAPPRSPLRYDMQWHHSGFAAVTSAPALHAA